MELLKKYAGKSSVLRKILLTIIGCAIMGAGMALFTIPNNLAPGGLSGLATAIAHVVPLPVGVLTLIFEVIVLLFALKMFGFKSMLYVIFASIMYSVSIDVCHLILPGYTGDILLASVLGGAMIGLGLALLFIEGISTSGTDMVSRMVKLKIPQFPAGSLLIAIDAIVVIVAVIVFREIEIALYSFVAIFVAGKVLDAVMQGVDYAKILMIVTDKTESMERVLCEELGRGVTELPAKGAFTKKEKNVLLTVARRNEVAETLKMVRAVDSAAFVILYNATEVRGEGFKDINL